jgi:predicted nucleotidyltransferase
LIGLTGAGSGAVQRELARLTQSGLVTVRAIGSQKHYQANPLSPVFAELCAIIRKTVGLAEPLRKALEPVATRIDAAFVFGSVAGGTDTAGSDIDLMIVSDTLGYADVYPILEAASAELARPVNPTILTRKDLERRLRDDGAFTKRVLERPRIWLIGDDDALGAR